MTGGFYVTGLYPGDVVTLYACWAWDAAANAGIITYGGATKTLNVGTNITSPSTATFMKIGSAVVDGTGAVRGTWTGADGEGRPDRRHDFQRVKAPRRFGRTDIGKPKEFVSTQ